MSTAQILNIAITVFTTVAIAALAWWARKHPNRSKEYPEQVRMPKVLLIFGWICVSVGLLMGLVAFSSDDARDPIAFRIASVAIFLGGMAFVVMYRNFYVAPRAYEVAFPPRPTALPVGVTRRGHSGPKTSPIEKIMSSRAGECSWRCRGVLYCDRC